MYNLPADFDPRVFVGREIIQVCFAANNVHLAFDADLALTIEGRFVHRSGRDRRAEQHEPPAITSELALLLSHRVRNAAADDDGALVLEFDDGQELICLNDTEQYECYRITRAGKEIIV